MSLSVGLHQSVCKNIYFTFNHVLCTCIACFNFDACSG